MASRVPGAVHDAPRATGDARRAWRVAGALAVGALLTISLGLNVVLARAVRRWFDASEALRLDPAGKKTYAAERTAPSPPGPLVVLFGDSRAAMWPPPPVPVGYEVVNRGIGYQTTAQIAMRVDDDVLPLHPSIVVLEAGVNDLKTIASFPARRAEIVAACEANLTRVVERCTGSGASVVLVSIFDIGDLPLWRRPFWSDDVSAAVREVNAYLPRLAGPRVIWFEASPSISDARGRIQRPLQFDYLHLLPAGYDALNQRLAPVLTKLPR